MTVGDDPGDGRVRQARFFILKDLRFAEAHRVVSSLGVDAVNAVSSSEEFRTISARSGYERYSAGRGTFGKSLSLQLGLYPLVW